MEGAAFQTISGGFRGHEISLAAGVVDLEGDISTRHHADRCADDRASGVHHLDPHLLARVLLQAPSHMVQQQVRCCSGV